MFKNNKQIRPGLLLRKEVYISDMHLGLGADKSLVWVEGDAEALSFEDNTMDGYTIAFGIRNVTHIEKALAEAYRYYLLHICLILEGYLYLLYIFKLHEWFLSLGYWNVEEDFFASN